MLREIDIDEISDGKRYKAGDMAKIDCNDCAGCSYCCHAMCDTIILDPYDIYMLEKAVKKSFEALIANELELNVEEGLILPNIRMQPQTEGCGFLSTEGRCTVHDFRPGFCRLFPLGRIYENDSFTYFIQKDECPYPSKSKVKIKKWLGIENLPEYERYILHYHNLCKKLIKGFSEDSSDSAIKSANMLFLNTLFVPDYDTEASFYEQYYLRCETLSSLNLC